jgi:hypothetical protein
MNALAVSTWEERRRALFGLLEAQIPLLLSCPRAIVTRGLVSHCDGRTFQHSAIQTRSVRFSMYVPSAVSI